MTAINVKIDCTFNVLDDAFNFFQRLANAGINLAGMPQQAEMPRVRPDFSRVYNEVVERQAPAPITADETSDDDAAEIEKLYQAEAAKTAEPKKRGRQPKVAVAAIDTPKNAIEDAPAPAPRDSRSEARFSDAAKAVAAEAPIVIEPEVEAAPEPVKSSFTASDIVDITNKALEAEVTSSELTNILKAYKVERVRFLAENDYAAYHADVSKLIASKTKAGSVF